MTEPFAESNCKQTAALSLSAADGLLPDGWRIRPMTPRDIPGVMSVESAIYPYPWTDGNFRDSISSGYSCWILLTGGDAPEPSTPLAYAVVMNVLDESHLMNLSVAQACQGRGYGRVLLAWLGASSRRRGSVGMFLEVRPSNLAALNLYSSVGFRRIGLRRNYYPNGASGREDAIVMRCPLTEPEVR